MNYQKKVLEYYNAEISEDYLPHGYNFEEISTEDGYYFFALRQDNNYCMYFYSESGAYDEIRSQIEGGGTVGCVDIDQIDFDLMYSEIIEEIQIDVEREAKQAILDLIKPTVITELHKKLSADAEYVDTFVAEDMDTAEVNDAINKRVLDIFSTLQFK